MAMQLREIIVMTIHISLQMPTVYQFIMNNFLEWSAALSGKSMKSFNVIFQMYCSLVCTDNCTGDKNFKESKIIKVFDCWWNVLITVRYICWYKSISHVVISQREAGDIVEISECRTSDRYVISHGRSPKNIWRSGNMPFRKIFQF